MRMRRSLASRTITTARANAVAAQTITAAVAFLKDEGFAASVTDSLAVVPGWQATSQGVARFQRRRVEQNPAEGEV